jgi:hypothetical protein
MTIYKCKPEFYDNCDRPWYQAMYRGTPLEGYYFIGHEDEFLFASTRQGYNYIWTDENYPFMVGRRCLSYRLLKNRVSGKSPYPKVNATVKVGKSLTIHLHQIVAQTFLEYPIPDGVTDSEWKRTPKAVKKHFESNYWEANHIDHDHMNYHPNNLEWVSRGVNVDKYHEHRVA